MTLQRMLKRVKREEGGFTLVELLIVVAIIAILAAIAIPQFSKYRLRSYKTALDSDTKNAFTAAQAYLTDHPNATVGATELTAGGYVSSPNITVSSANMTNGAGSIILVSSTLKSAAKFNISTVDYNGTYAFVTAP